MNQRKRAHFGGGIRRANAIGPDKAKREDVAVNSGPGDQLLVARVAYERRAWAEAYFALIQADRTTALSPGNLKLLAEAARLVGQDDQSAASWARAYRGFLEEGDLPAAARCAFYLSRQLAEQRELAQASGWQSRAKRLLEDSGLDCPEAGFLMLPDALRAIAQADPDAAYEISAARCSSATVSETRIFRRWPGSAAAARSSPWGGWNRE
ncbi:MAG: hypothetical protein ACT4OM_07050 [Actinomycetota bacterium]